MRRIAVSKMGAWSFFTGPVVALVFFLLVPGGLLIDSAPSVDAVASISALASNAAWSKSALLLVTLGLCIALYGLFALQAVIRDDGFGDALARYGVLFLMITVIGWIFSQGISIMLADTEYQSDQALQSMAPVYTAELGISLICTFTAALGYLTLSVGLATSGDYNRPACVVAALAAIVALGALIVRVASGSDLELAETAMTVVRYCYFLWVLWNVIIGINILRNRPI